MTFELVRIGWPNTAAVLALAVMPIVSLATSADPRPGTVEVRQTEPAAICPLPVRLAVAMVAVPDTRLE
jgi:hypothetical protein